MEFELSDRASGRYLEILYWSNGIVKREKQDTNGGVECLDGWCCPEGYQTILNTCVNPSRLCSHPCRTQKEEGAYLQGSPKRWEADATMPLIQPAMAIHEKHVIRLAYLRVTFDLGSIAKDISLQRWSNQIPEGRMKKA
jgi:hypothetical protein